MTQEEINAEARRDDEIARSWRAYMAACPLCGKPDQGGHICDECDERARRDEAAFMALTWQAYERGEW